MGEGDSEQRWQDRFDELAYPSSVILLGLLLIAGKITGWTVPTSMRRSGILELLYNPIGILVVLLVGIVWLWYDY